MLTQSCTDLLLSMLKYSIDVSVMITKHTFTHKDTPERKYKVYMYKELFNLFNNDKTIKM